MKKPTEERCARKGARGGYLMVLLAVILAFVGVMAGMQLLILVSVATTARAYDSHRQGATEAARLQRVVHEALLAVRQISVADTATSLEGALAVHLAQLNAGGTTLLPIEIPSAVPGVATFPNEGGTADPLVPLTPEVTACLTPELRRLAGARAAVYPELQFEFASERPVLEAVRRYQTRVTARLLAVPLTRFPMAAYDLPAEIGQGGPATAGAAPSALPAGLVPARDPAFLTGLQAAPGVLPYHYRHRAALAAAYQYVFSSQFVDRVAEYAGITHFHDLGAVSATAELTGLVKNGNRAEWDLGRAGSGRFGTIEEVRNAAVLFATAGGHALRLHDSVGENEAAPLLLLLLGPADPRTGSLEVELGAIARPTVIIGYNVRVAVPASAAVRGALLLDPASALTAAGTLSLGHLSYWAGSTSVAAGRVVATSLPELTEPLAPRVVYVATTARRL